MKKLAIDLERCVGCKRCELACMAEHSDSKDNLYGFIVDKPQPKTRIFIEIVEGKPIPLVCRQCKEPLCVSACMSGTMQKDRKTGIVTNTGHEQKCVGCWMCVMACPFGVINTSQELTTIERFSFCQSLKCDFCPDKSTPSCVEACPEGAISVVEVEEETKHALCDIR
jgi:anaerobic carbon-monoxide dehydrogenase iron sulfur subunit